MANWPSKNTTESPTPGPDDERPPELLAKHKAMSLLASREHTRAELEDKLSKRQHPAEAIAIALDDLADRGWQSDERFAELFVEQRANRGKGPRLIRQELLKRGISSELSSQTLRQSSVDWGETATRTLANRFIMGDDYAKMRRFLEQRGFESAHARAAIDALGASED